jgi:hypothetical protein
MGDYYEVLGVGPRATADEIRKAYRTLAFRFHPDVSREANATARFREISQAYKVLGDPRLRSAYDQRQAFVSASPPHPDPAYNPHYWSRGSGEPTAKELMLEHIHWVRWGSKVGFALTLLFAMDFLLPSRRTTERVIRTENVYYVTRTGRVMVYDLVYLVTGSGKKLEVPRVFEEQRGDRKVSVSSSLILGVPIRVVLEGTDMAARFKGTLYGNFAFFPALLCLLSSIGLFGPAKVDWRFNAGIASYLLILLNVIVLVYSTL